MKSSFARILLLVQALPACAFASNSVVNLSHYDFVRPDFVAMKNEGVVGVIHEATYPRFERDAKYYERQLAALEAGVLWGAYHFADATDPIRQADHFLYVVAAARPPIRPNDPEKRRHGVLLVLDFEKNGLYPGLYGSEYRLRQMLYGRGVTEAQRQTLTNCWLWIANYHSEPRNTAPWSTWHLWQYTGDGKCDLRPRGSFPKSVANVRKAERNIFRGNNTALQAFWRANAWYPSG